MPNEFDWRKYGENYPEVDERLGGLPSWIRRIVPKKGGGEEASFGAPGLAPFSPAAVGALGLAAPAATALAAPAALGYGIGKLVAPKKTEEVVGKLKEFGGRALKGASALGSAYETGMVESIPGAKAAKLAFLKPEHREFLEQIKAQHPLAAKAGKTAGMVGQMALPGAAIAKGGSLASVAANAALNAAPIAIGTGLDVGVESGSPLAGLQAGALSQALGTLAPTAITGLTRIPGVQKALARLQSSAAGIRMRDIFKVLNRRAKQLTLPPNQTEAYMAKAAPDLVEKIADKVDEFGYGPAGKRALKKWSSEGFETHAKLFDQATGGGRLSADDLVAVSQDPEIDQLKRVFGPSQVDDQIQSIASEIEGTGWTKSRKRLGNYAEVGYAADRQAVPMNDPRRLSAKIAEVMGDRIDDIADNLAEAARNAGQAIPSLDELKITYPAVLAQQSAAAREAARIPVGEAGSPTAARLLLHQLLPRAGVGGLTAAGLTPEMIQRPETIPGNVMKILLASALGQYATKGAGILGRQAAGRGAGLLRNLTPRAVTAIGRGAALTPGAAAAETPARASEGPAGPETAGIELAEAGATPQKVEEAKQATNAAFEGRVMQELQRAWVGLQQAGTRLTFDEFTGLVRQYTNNFDPKMSAPILFRDPKERERYLQTYERALALGRMDIPRALAGGGLIGQESALQRKSRDDLISLMASILGGPEKIAEKKYRDIAERDLQNIRRLKLPAAGQRAALLDLLRTNYGLDLDLLNQYGIAV